VTQCKSLSLVDKEVRQALLLTGSSRVTQLHRTPAGRVSFCAHPIGRSYA